MYLPTYLELQRAEARGAAHVEDTFGGEMVLAQHVDEAVVEVGAELAVPLLLLLFWCVVVCIGLDGEGRIDKIVRLLGVIR